MWCRLWFVGVVEVWRGNRYEYFGKVSGGCFVSLFDGLLVVECGNCIIVVVMCGNGG